MFEEFVTISFSWCIFFWLDLRDRFSPRFLFFIDAHLSSWVTCAEYGKLSFSSVEQNQTCWDAPTGQWHLPFTGADLPPVTRAGQPSLPFTALGWKSWLMPSVCSPLYIQCCAAGCCWSLSGQNPSLSLMECMVGTLWPVRWSKQSRPL